jgi:aryl-alcohol dehydrogenase-like predicted oxidoreductase
VFLRGASRLTTHQTLAYLFHQFTHVFPIVGAQTVEHIKLLPVVMSVKPSTTRLTRYTVLLRSIFSS